MYLFCGVVFANYTMNELKSLYGEPRPYWLSDKISAVHCGTGFGNPSGHMLNNSFLWVSLYLHVFFDTALSFGDQEIDREGGSPRRVGPLSRFIALLVMAGFLGMMAVSRVYLGAHTLNQVLFGTLIGSTLAAIGHFKVKPIFMMLP